jgi:phosphoribosyl 1,2-cyclic phosphodiesterase
VRTGKRSACQIATIRNDARFCIGRLGVQAFRLSHDARDPVGYVITLPDGTRLGIATDLGHPNPEAVKALEGCEILGLECNHDPDLLRDGPYPWVLKKRIGSDQGHLSNPSAADLLARLAGPGLRQVFALHLSETNNRPHLARRALTGCLKDLKLPAQVTTVGRDGAVGYPTAGQMNLL